MRTWPGTPYPLGATWDGEGVNFAIFSENATAVELCLFDGPDSDRDSARIRVEEQTGSGLARVPAGGTARTALWLPHPWAL